MIEELTTKNMQLRASNEEKSKIIMDLEFRINKSIELIENNYYLKRDTKEKYIIEEEINEILKYLKGDNNE